MVLTSQVRRLVLAAGLLLLGAGCYQDKAVVLHQAGVYQGPYDDYQQKATDAAHGEMLKKRFRMGQTDR